MIQNSAEQIYWGLQPRLQKGTAMFDAKIAHMWGEGLHFQEIDYPCLSVKSVVKFRFD
jgi:hypothetical protein